MDLGICLCGEIVFLDFMGLLHLLNWQRMKLFVRFFWNLMIGLRLNHCLMLKSFP